MSKGYEYKVIEVIDKDGSVDTKALASKLNEYGAEGWHVVAAYSNELGMTALRLFGVGINSTADQNIIVLERELEHRASELQAIQRNEALAQRDKEIESQKKQEEDKRLTALQNYIDAQLKKDNLQEIKDLQDLYFGTTSLEFLKSIVPDAYEFDKIEEYKSKLESINISDAIGKVVSQ